MPFDDEASFDFDAYGKVVRTAVRALDNVLDVTYWPLQQQKEEAANKRRVGLGFMGLGDTLVMLKIKYNSAEALQFAEKVSKVQCHEAYRASIELAKEKGAFPLFDANEYLAQPRFASRLPEDIKSDIRKHGIRNSHLISIAPTGTIALAFADNTSNGIEPAFSWRYYRNRRMNDNSTQKLTVEDHAYRVYSLLHGETEPENLPSYFVAAQDITATEHLKMVAAVLPYVDSAISKTINVAEDYPYDDFVSIYMEAWKAGLKGITTYRPNATSGAVLEIVKPKADALPNDIDTEQAFDPRVKLDSMPTPVLDSLRWPGRPKQPNGSEGWVSETLEHHLGAFNVFVSHIKNGVNKPFEVWVMGAEQPRGLGAIAKTLSMDMRANDKAMLVTKLDALEAMSGDDAFMMISPETGEPVHVGSIVSAFAKMVRYRCDQLDALTLKEGDKTPVVDALFCKNEPKTGTNGTMSWTVDVVNPATGDDFVLGVKELLLPDGSRRPYSVWLARNYPRTLDGLCTILSLDMRVVDPAWIGMKLKKLFNFAEPRGDFIAKVPGSDKSQNFPSTVAYVAQLLMHRYNLLGILNKDGEPVVKSGILSSPDLALPGAEQNVVVHGKECPECHVKAVIKKDGCDFCTSCAHIGSCG